MKSSSPLISSFIVRGLEVGGAGKALGTRLRRLHLLELTLRFLLLSITITLLYCYS